MLGNDSTIKLCPSLDHLLLTLKNSIAFLFFAYVKLMRAITYVCGSEKPYRIWLSLSTMWVSGIKLRSFGFLASLAFIYFCYIFMKYGLTMAQYGLKLVVSYLRLPSIGIKDMHHHAWLQNIFDKSDKVVFHSIAIKNVFTNNNEHSIGHIEGEVRFNSHHI